LYVVGWRTELAARLIETPNIHRYDCIKCLICGILDAFAFDELEERLHGLAGILIIMELFTRFCKIAPLEFLL
jgi:hypothetical protein